MRTLVLILMLAVALPAGAHHPFTPYYDGSKLEVLDGVVAELRLINPHVELIVDVSSPNGRRGRWAFEGAPPNTFSRIGVDMKTKLQPGTRITISGWPARDPAARAFSGREITFADKSTLSFGPTPAEGDRWQCVGPCAYKYPVVPSP